MVMAVLTIALLGFKIICPQNPEHFGSLPAADGGLWMFTRSYSDKCSDITLGKCISDSLPTLPSAQSIQVIDAARAEVSNLGWRSLLGTTALQLTPASIFNP